MFWWILGISIGVSLYISYHIGIRVGVNIGICDTMLYFRKIGAFDNTQIYSFDDFLKKINKDNDIDI